MHESPTCKWYSHDADGYEIYSLRVVNASGCSLLALRVHPKLSTVSLFFRVIKSSLQTVHFQVPTSMNFALFFCTFFLYLHFFFFYLQKLLLLIHFWLSLRSTPWATTMWKKSSFRLVGSGEGREEKSLKLPSTTHKWDANRMSFKLFFFTSPWCNRRGLVLDFSRVDVRERKEKLADFHSLSLFRSESSSPNSKMNFFYRFTRMNFTCTNDD